MKLSLPLLGITDKRVVENFRLLRDFLKKDGFLCGEFVLIDYKATAAGTFLLAHGLKFIPLDAITISRTQLSTATVTWNFDAFTATQVSVTVSGPVRIRALVGTYKEDTL